MMELYFRKTLENYLTQWDKHEFDFLTLTDILNLSVNSMTGSSQVLCNCDVPGSIWLGTFAVCHYPIYPSTSFLSLHVVKSKKIPYQWSLKKCMLMT